ncbi:helix-turn-helix domain-containing protein [Actinocrispum wychmicini]|uniref:Helix-turn-helix protein n=1 Tax=Actinocrispum wychmicini TaxID=1213861 RepID=A0A4R2J2F3_9PSEU|nr:helix-turn-helix transcriptional regulator [Actinocrispum wychmicini]TCO52423.1 helix-turn-helix protein [Actinocrispum wychmicini]
MGRARQTFERRQLGLTLRRLRDQATETQQAAADAIGRVRSRIVELEEGKGTLNQEDLARLLDFYGVSPAARETVLALGAKARRRQRSRPYTDLLPDSHLRFADLEVSATEIRCYESSLVPGLLQSPAYVRAIIEDGDGIWWEPSDPEPDERISFRMDRQEKTLYGDTHKSFWFVIGEEALRANVAGPDVMREQLRHIQKLCDERPDLTVQVLPQGTPSNPIRGGAFTLFDFAGAAPPVGVYSVVFGSELYFDEPSDTASLRRAFARLSDQLALDPIESARLIGSIAEAV